VDCESSLNEMKTIREATTFVNPSSQLQPVADSCLNCAVALEAGQRFCAACGQKSTTARLTMRDIAHDILHALTHADHSIFALVRDLATHPGRVAREYIEGKRKRHFGPWAFLLITVGLASIVIHLADVQWFKPYSQSHATDILHRHINLVILLQMPLLAGVCALLFYRQRLNYAEHLVFAAYTSGLRALFLAVIETPLLAITQADTADPRLAVGYYGVWFAYFTFAAVQFYGGNRLWSACKAIAAAILSQVLIIAMLMGFVFLFVLFGEN
jgi:hypothetical protein